MENFSLVLYKTENKFSTVQKLVLTETSAVDVSENDYVFIYLTSSTVIDQQSYLWLSNFQFPLIYEKKENGKYYYSLLLNYFFGNREKEIFSHSFRVDGDLKTFYKLFINNYGVCQLEFETLEDFKKCYFNAGLIKVSSSKINDVNYLLDYLLGKDIYYWESLSLTKNEASDINKSKENILWILSKIKTIINEFENYFLPQLRIDPFYKLQPFHDIIDWSDSNTLTEDSLLWIVDNLNQLEQTHYYDENKFLLLNRNYKTKEIYSQTLNRDTDISENRVIHLFVEELYSYLNIYLNTIKEKLAIVKGQIDFKSQMQASYFNRLQDIIGDLQKSLGAIKNHLNELIPVKQLSNAQIQSFRVDSKFHYQSVYRLINLFRNNKEAIFSQDVLFTGTNDISKLYEIYCLFKLVDLLTTYFHFEPITTINSPLNQFKRSNDQLFSNELNLYSLYSFKNDSDVEIKLYYELLPDEIVSVVRGGERSFRPDFILEIASKKEKSYVILDAKYKKIGTIENHDYEDLALKYLHGIAPKIGGVFNVLGLIILNPIAGSGLDFYQKGAYSMFGTSPASPQIGRVELAVENVNINYLAKTLEYFFHLADLQVN